MLTWAEEDPGWTT